ncbi:MAG TPA: hypothetical protein VLA23_00180 [Candidatus Limnocylindrales bacterium]|nr:hypothetical protein [Candidatus Limnocylindrales bacterium]
MEFTITMSAAGWLLLGGGALVIGIAYQLIGQVVAEVTMPYEWVVTAIVAFLGGLVAGQFVTAWLTIEPVWEGLALLPAAIGGLVAGGVAAIAVRLVSGGTLVGKPHAV